MWTAAQAGKDGSIQVSLLLCHCKNVLGVWIGNFHPGVSMSHVLLARLRDLAILVAFVASAAPLQAADRGFEEYLKHQHSDTIILPRLYEPAPRHVPVVSNEELVRLWESPHGSPILRNAGIEIRLYEAILTQREHNPEQFDRMHPTEGRLLSDRTFFDYAMYLYHLDTRRFVHYHHHLIPLIRGEAMVLMAPTGQGTAPQTIEMMTPPIVPPVPEEINYTPLPPQPLTVPEPASIVTLAVGTGILGAGLWLRRRLQ
jgi:hypothetical protein